MPVPVTRLAAKQLRPLPRPSRFVGGIEVWSLSRMNDPVGAASPFFTAEHELLRAQVRRFVEDEVKPNAAAWESEGYVPRPVLKRMGALGFFGIRYPEQYGGSGLDTLATVVLAEELGRSTFSGVAITALVHTDMASV